MIFFSQNDKQWKKELLGKSKCTCGQFGCTTCCIGIAGSWFEENITPWYLTKRLEYTIEGWVIWASIGKVYKKMEFLVRFKTFDEKLIAEGMKNPDKFVILNVDRGYHWVAVLGKWPVLGYRCVDPYPYPAKIRFYKPAEVEGGAVLRRK